MRLEHHWAAPDAEPLGFYVEEVSSTHFWTVDGTWEDGIEGTDALTLDARFSYVGSDSDQLDYDLFAITEQDAFLAWRPDSDSEWVQYPDYEWQAGSLENGNGTFKVLSLRKGQYTFANGDISLNLPEATLDADFNLYPSPASSHINLNWIGSADAVSIYDNAGRCVKTVSYTHLTLPTICSV